MVLAICSALKVPALCGPFLLLVPLSSLTLVKATGSLSPQLIIGNEQCFLGVVHLDVCSVHASLPCWMSHYMLWQHLLGARSLLGLCLSRQVTSLMLSSSSQSLGHFHLKVMGMSLLCPTSLFLLLESQMRFVLLSFLSNRDCPRPSRLHSKVVFLFS